MKSDSQRETHDARIGFHHDFNKIPDNTQSPSCDLDIHLSSTVQISSRQSGFDYHPEVVPCRYPIGTISADQIGTVHSPSMIDDLLRRYACDIHHIIHMQSTLVEGCRFVEAVSS